MSDIKDYSRPMRRIGKLYWENAKLITTEKVTIVLTIAILCAVGAQLLFIASIVMALGAAQTLSQYMVPTAAYGCVAGFYVLIIILLILLRRPLIMNPIARFLSRLIMEEPTEEDQSQNPDDDEQA